MVNHKQESCVENLLHPKQVRTMEKKSIFSKASVIFAFLAIFLLSSTGQAADFTKITVRLSTNGTDLANDTRAAKMFAQKIAEKTGGAVKVQVFPNEQLAGGNFAKGVSMLSQGVTDMAVYSTSPMSALDDRLMVSTMPWALSSYEEAEKLFLPENSGGQFIASVLKGKGLVYLGATHNGFKAMTNGKRAIRAPEDLRGMKVRVPGGALFMDFYRSLGADPVAMSWGEVFTALQQGTIDGHDNSLSTINSANVFEVQKYISITGHAYEAFTFAINERKFKQMNEATQKIFGETLVEACLEMNALAVKEEQGIREKFEKAGCEVIDITPENLAKFKEIVRAPVTQKYGEKYGKEACAAFNITF